MLVLSRRIGETLVVGDDVKISVLGVKGKQVRLGISAPKTVTVHREEIYKKIKEENSQGISSGHPNGFKDTTYQTH